MKQTETETKRRGKSTGDKLSPVENDSAGWKKANDRCCQHRATASNYPVDSIKKSEPFKMWLAQVGCERIEEVIDPELTIERALETYAKKVLYCIMLGPFRFTLRSHCGEKYGLSRQNNMQINV